MQGRKSRRAAIFEFLSVPERESAIGLPAKPAPAFRKNGNSSAASAATAPPCRPFDLP
jgi:hypothetical protein